jgi:butyrate kinase
MKSKIILVINPGSTSTKMAVFDDENQITDDTLHHDAETLAQFKTIWDQYDFRMQAVLAWIAKININPSAVVGVGGLLKPLASGTYRVNESMLADARANLQGEHASNLSCVMVNELAKKFGCPALVVDPVSVDEFEPLARYSGHPLIQRKTLAHVLSIHAAARHAAEILKLDVNQSNFIVAHLGGGISIAPVKNNHIIDINDASSDGPFSPERTGGLPLQQFISLCFSGKYTEAEIRKLIMGGGGLLAYLGTTSAVEIESRISQKDSKAREVFEAMAYQIAKEIGGMATVLYGKVDAIVLTGGLSNSNLLINWIKERIIHLGKIIVYIGESEMKTMALSALRILRSEESAKKY